MTTAFHHLRWLAAAALSLLAGLPGGNGSTVQAQSSVASTSIRPFVTGQIPIIGRGGVVGGVLIDAEGMVARSDPEILGRLHALRIRALHPVASELQVASPLRKISLKGITQELTRLRAAGQPVPEALQYLAGLQRVEYVLAYPESEDIVLAGFAEGWTVDRSGMVVGRTTGDPVLLLDDLIVALRTGRQAAMDEGISCSMDPSPEGLRRLQRVLQTRGLPMNEGTARRLEQALGDQQIRVTGVPPSSHFACVMVAADVMLKRLGMHLEPTPVEGMPSYLAMLPSRGTSAQPTAMPRFWLAPHYQPLLRDPEGLAWQIRGNGVQARAEEGTLGPEGTPLRHGRRGSLAEQWAETFTGKYPQLAEAWPVFHQLRNCMDLAVVAALFVKEELPRRTQCDLTFLLDPDTIQLASYPVPKRVASQASLFRAGGTWLVAVSGGVAVDSWSVLQTTQVQPELVARRRAASTAPAAGWWWD